MKSVTKNGIEVTLDPKPNISIIHGQIREYYPEVRVSLVAPGVGEVSFVGRGDSFQMRKGQWGVAGDAYVGSKYTSVCVTVPRKDWEAALAEAKSLGKTMAEEMKAQYAREVAEAKAACPDGYEIATSVWSNGDLCAECWRAEDGTEGTANDLAKWNGLHGWKFIPSATFGRVRERASEAKAKAAIQAEKKAAHEQQCLATAKETGRDVTVERWIEDGEDDHVYCSRVATPAGKIESREFGQRPRHQERDEMRAMRMEGMEGFHDAQ